MVKGNDIKQKKKILRNNNKWSEKQVTKKANYSQGRIYKTLVFSVAFAKQYRNYEIAKEILKEDNSWDKRQLKVDFSMSHIYCVTLKQSTSFLHFRMPVWPS